jgi:tetratricopeptide (TPR) repeat protein
MKKSTVSLLGAAAVMVLWASSYAHANEQMLASAKSLYESAAYEAALSELSSIQTTELADVVDTYRALCLLALGRVRDAEQALGAIVARKPLLVLSDADYSPRIVALFREVRKKALPAAARQLYSQARSEFEEKKYAAAAAGFKQALQVIADADPESQTSTLGDLKELADGFLMLAEVKAAAVASPPPAEAAPAAAVVAAQVSRAFYTLVDKDVTPPVVLMQAIPRWSLATKMPLRALEGTLELLIDETGAVETATMAEPVWPPYDIELVRAARRWRYEPALKDGTPVKFKRFLAINVDPSAQRSP